MTISTIPRQPKIVFCKTKKLFQQTKGQNLATLGNPSVARRRCYQFPGCVNNISRPATRNTISSWIYFLLTFYAERSAGRKISWNFLYTYVYRVIRETYNLGVIVPPIIWYDDKHVTDGYTLRAFLNAISVRIWR